MSDIIYCQLYKNNRSYYVATKAGWKSKPFRPWFSTSSQSWNYLVQIISSRYIKVASYIFCHMCRNIVTYMLHYLYLLQLSSTYYIASASYNCHVHTASFLYPTFIFYLSYLLSILSFTILCILNINGVSTKPQFCSVSLRLLFKFPIRLPDTWRWFFIFSNHPGKVKDFATKIRHDGSFI
jgi:hypothetical protein